MAIGAHTSEAGIASSFPAVSGSAKDPAAIERLPFKSSFVGFLIARGDPTARARTAELALAARGPRPSPGRGAVIPSRSCSIRGLVLAIMAVVGIVVAGAIRVFLVPVFVAMAADRPGQVSWDPSFELSIRLFLVAHIVALAVVLEQIFPHRSPISGLAGRFGASGLAAWLDPKGSRIELSRGLASTAHSPARPVLRASRPKSPRSVPTVCSSRRLQSPPVHGP